jgi:deoxyribodipyrimidine photo-lyase
LSDNQALTETISSAKSVIPVFVLDPKLIDSPNASPKRLAFLYKGLAQLDADLQEKGSKLIIRQGNPKEALSNLVKDSGAKQLYAEADFSPYARTRDVEVARDLPLKLVGGSCVSHPESVLKKDGETYKVFTPFMRAWKSLYQFQTEQLLPVPEHIHTPKGIASEEIPVPTGLSSSLLIQPGEKPANNRLHDFISGELRGIYQYSDTRNLMDIRGTAQISPYLRFGMLSARLCVSAAQQALQHTPDDHSKRSAEIWLNELIWREFFISILYHYPSVLQQSFREELRAIPWRNDLSEFSAWCDGRTGYPIIDAAMRQLLNTGWMHNRGRMIVASFLVKHLLIDWRWGEKFFMQHLIDGDPAANNGGWQWTAGTGTDAATYFRVFNPILQSKKFDPHGNFIRKWIPELSGVPGKYLHEPWKMPKGIQRQSGCNIGRDYPLPIVDHRFARERVLEVYNRAKKVYQQ